MKGQSTTQHVPPLQGVLVPRDGRSATLALVLEKGDMGVTKLSF